MAYNINRLRQQYTLGGNDDYGLNMGQNTGIQLSDYEDPPPYQEEPQSDIRGIRQDRGANPPPDPSSLNLHSSRLFGGDEDNSEPSLWDTINQFYTPANRAGDRFNTLLDKVPKLEDYEPSMKRRIVAAMQGWEGGPDAVQKTLNAPYAKALGTWKEQAGPFQQAASLENAANNIERQLAGNAASSLITGRRNADQARAADERNRITEANNTARNETARQRAAAQNFKDTHPAWEISFRGRDVIAVSPDGQQRLNLGPTTNWDPVELENLKQEGRVVITDKNNAAAMERTNASNAELYQDQAGNRYSWSPTDGIKPESGSPAQPVGQLTKIANPVTPKTMSPGDQEKNTQRTLESTFNMGGYDAQFVEYDADAKTYKVKSLPLDASPQQQKGYADFLAKVYPEKFQPKKDINLPLEPGQIREDRTAPPITTPPPNTGGRGGIAGAGAGGLGGDQQPQTGMTVEQQQAAARQQRADIQSGKMFKVTKPGFKDGTIPNTPEAIADARAKGWTVVVGGGGR